jgi:hypothetical protein
MRGSKKAQRHRKTNEKDEKPYRTSDSRFNFNPSVSASSVKEPIEFVVPNIGWCDTHSPK